MPTPVAVVRNHHLSVRIGTAVPVRADWEAAARLVAVVDLVVLVEVVVVPVPF